MKFIPSLVLGPTLASFVIPAEAIVVANYSDATNLRFADDPSFIGSGFDLSGVGRLSQLSPADSVNKFREGTWATALGPNYFLSANHFAPDAGSEITFFAGNSTSSSAFTYQVGGGFRVGTTDLWIGYTIDEIDPSINRYGFASTPANALGDLGLGNETLYLSGDRIPGRPGTVTDHVLATNQAESFYNEGSGQFESPDGSGVTVSFTPPAGFENDMIILFENLPGDDAAPLFHESLLASGDSGSPLFRESGGTLTILGVGSLRLDDVPGNFIDTPGGGPLDPLEERNASLYTYTGSYTSEIAAAIAQVPAPVPEPGSALVLALGLTLGLRRKR